MPLSECSDEKRAAELKSKIKTLRNLARACEGDDRPECPIIEELEGDNRSGAMRNGKADKEKRLHVRRSVKPRRVQIVKGLR
jgi:hypothetical protein